MKTFTEELDTRAVSVKKEVVSRGPKRCACGQIIERNRKFCDACLKNNITKSKKEYEKRRKTLSMSAPKRAAISRNHILQTVIRNKECQCAMENGINNLSTFNRWANGKGASIYKVFAKETVHQFLNDYLDSRNGNPVERMNRIIQQTPDMRANYYIAYMNHAIAAGYLDTETFARYEEQHPETTGAWRAQWLWDNIQDNIYIINAVDFSDAGTLIEADGKWR